MNTDTYRLLEYEEMKGLFLPFMASDLGKGLLARLEPSRDRDAITERLEFHVEVLTVLERGARIPLGGCHDLGPVLAGVRDHGRPLEPDELSFIGETLECARNLVIAVQAIAREHEDLALPRILDLTENVPAFTFLTDRIDDIVDERGRVRDEASAKLKDLRDRIGAARERIEKRLNSLLGRREFRACLQEVNPRYRSGRIVLPVKTERRGEVRGILHDVSQTGATSFVEPEELVADGNALEDLLAQERREVTRVLWEITVKVLEAEAAIREALSALARVDLAVGCGRAASELGLDYPRQNDEGVQRFRRARHPVLLQITSPDKVVPVDLRMGEDFHLLVITGPNTGGKTVALKTLGLLLLMAQAGLPVPADDPEFCPVSDILVDVGDEQSLEQSLSTFSSHVGRIARFLESADEKTLVLLDELGSGTDPAEGAALGRAILDFLHSRRVPAVVTTHLGDLNPRNRDTLRTFTDLLRLIRSFDQGTAGKIEKKLEGFKFGLILNMLREHGETRIGGAYKSMINRCMGIQMDHLGQIYYDEKIPLAVKNFEPFIVKYPHTKASHSIRLTAKRILGIDHLSSTLHQWPPLFAPKQTERSAPAASDTFAEKSLKEKRAKGLRFYL